MGRLSFPGERKLLAAQQRERERVRKSWEASQARTERVWNGLPPEPEPAESAGDAGSAPDGNATGGSKPDLRVDDGHLVAAAEGLRDLIVASQRCYERGVPVCIARREGDDLPLAAALTKNSVVRMAEALCTPRRKAAELPQNVRRHQERRRKA